MLEQVPAVDRRSRVECSWVALRAFLWSLTGAAFVVTGIVIMASLNTLIGAPLWEALITGPIVGVTGIAVVFAWMFTHGRGRVWRLTDHRGTATLIVDDKCPAGVKFTAFGAVPRKRGLGTDLGTAVLHTHLARDETVRAVATPRIARHYMEHGFVRDTPPGRLWWRIVANHDPSTPWQPR